MINQGEKIFTKHLDNPNCHTLDFYLKNGGTTALSKALEMKPEEIIEELKKSNLRGRGGAGFPAGLKLSFMPKNPQETGRPNYLVCNADEGEPGTFKDRLIMTRTPQMLIEGMTIAGYAIRSHVGYIYIRGEFVKEYFILEKALIEARKKGLLGKNILGKGYDFDIFLYRGAGAYICGEETGLLSSLEGRRGEPRPKPPFPAQVGAFGMPTCVNNVETLAVIPYILREGAEKFASFGTPKAGGMRLYSVSGHIENPGVYELPLTITLRELIDHCGGVKNGKKLKAVIPGGASAPMLKADEIDVTMDFDGLAAKGTMAGSGGVILMDESVCIVRAASRLLNFYEHESCGQCSQCREGSHWLASMFRRLEAGGGTTEDLDAIANICSNMAGKTICAFADAVTGPALSSVKKFREEFEAHVHHKGCPMNGVKNA
jgi:NADH-quinone oxidoreductase subunit F